MSPFLFSRERHLLPRDGLILCAVSGGADSMYLLANLLAHREQAGFQIAAAHYDHHLRETSARDAQFVQDWCRQNHIDCVLGGGDVSALARQRGRGIEETARELRYEFLQNTARTLGAEVIATAHNADDNGETVLMNLLRGCGLDGLCGIPPRRGNIVRPLLATTRREIQDWLIQHGVPYVEDETNQDETYTRNFLRHQVMPLLRQVNPRAVEHMTSAALRVRQDNHILSAQAAQISAKAQNRASGLAISVREFRNAPTPVALRAVKQLIRRAGGHNVTEAHLRSVLALIQSEYGSAEIALPALLVRRTYHEVWFCPRCGQDPSPPEQPVVLDGLTRWGGWIVSCEPAPCPAGATHSREDFWLSQGKLAGPLHIRARQKGDWLRPPGRPGKTLKKWFMDEKVPRAEREQRPVVWDGTKVVAVGGLGPQAELLATLGESALHITLSREREEHHAP